MPDELTRLHVRARLELVEAPPGGGPAEDAAPAGPLTFSGLAAPWNVRAQLNWWGDTFELAPGSLRAARPSDVKLLADHRDHAFGYATALESTDDGLVATFAIPRGELDDARTASTVRQMSNGVRDALSIGASIEAADEQPGEERGTVHYVVTAARLVEVSSVTAPRFEGARHPPIAASLRATEAGPDDDEQEQEEPDDDDAESTVVDDDDDQEADDVPDTDTATRAAAHTAATRPITTARARAPQRFESFGHFALAAARGELGDDVAAAMPAAWLAAEARRRRHVTAALADQVTTDTPGLVHDVWVGDVVDLMGSVSPMLEAFSSRPLPAEGNVVHVPYMSQYPDVGIQPAEKGPIATRKVLVPDADFPVLTFAGGQDVSLQAILRSSPAYLDVLMRGFAKVMALETNQWFAGITVPGATAGPAWPAAATGINGAFVDAAAALLAATLQWPEVAVLSVAAWQAMAHAVDTDGRPIFPTVSPWNPVGQVSLRSGDGSIRDLSFSVDPTVGGTWALVGLRDAATSFLGPVGTLTADVPAVLGRDVAVYRFAAGGYVDPRGVIRIGAAALTAEASSSSSSKSK